MQATMDLCQHASLRCAVRQRLFDLRMRVTVYNPPTGSSHGRPAVVPAKWRHAPFNSHNQEIRQQLFTWSSSWISRPWCVQRTSPPCLWHTRDFGVDDQTEFVTDPENIEAQPNFFIQTIPDKTNSTITIEILALV